MGGGRGQLRGPRVRASPRRAAGGHARPCDELRRAGVVRRVAASGARKDAEGPVSGAARGARAGALGSRESACPSADELGTATNIKSRVNRLSVLAAITSVQQRLKLYNKVPPNGLVLYCGTIMTAENKEKKVSIDFEPFKPINTSLYLCDNKFHTEALQELLQSDQKFGFIVMDGSGALFGTLSGNTREVLHKLVVELPKKHGRGGQSALRFARLRLERRHNYLRRVGELAEQFFITNDRPNVVGLVLAGSAEFKQKLSQSDMFDPRLQAIVLKIVDVSYGGENGFNQAIELSADALANVKFVHEKKLLSDYFAEISQDTGKYCYGVKDTMRALSMNAVDTLIMFEGLTVKRVVVRHPVSNTEKELLISEQDEKDPNLFKDPENPQIELDIVDETMLVDYLANQYRQFGCKLEFVTDRSQEGSQFVKGFGGIGGILRYKVDFVSIDDDTGEHRPADGDDDGSDHENKEDEESLL
jgi:peptide chain release factor subunit 1